MSYTDDSEGHHKSQLLMDDIFTKAIDQLDYLYITILHH